MDNKLLNPELTNALLIDVLCDRFEAAWGGTESPRIEDYLGEIDEPARSLLLRQFLQIEIECRYRLGHRPSLDEYMERFPDQGPMVEDLFQLLSLDEDIQSTQLLSGDTEPKADEAKTSHRQAVSDGAAFQVLRKHAEGGLGVISIARDQQLNREVALKEIQSRCSGDGASRARFIAEAEITGRLEHPGIVPVYALDQHPDGRPYYAMRFVRGETLQDAIKELHPTLNKDSNQSMPSVAALRRLIRRFMEVCNTIAYAHSRGVIHRDLKPQNILLGPYGETLIIDWGLAKSLGSIVGDGVAEENSGPVMASSPVETEFGRIAGTPGYMSPEQAKGSVELTAACDIYGLGATLYCILTGRAPRIGTDKSQQIAAAQRGEFPPPRQIIPKLPRSLEAICLKSMHVEAAQRYACATDLADDLEAWLEDEPVSCLQEQPLEQVARWTRKNRSWVGIAGAALAIVAVVAIIAAVSVDQSRRRESVARGRATENLQTSLDAIDQMLTNVGNEQLAAIPQLSPVRRALLDDALALLESIHERQPTDPGVKHRLARVQMRVGQLASWMNEHERALDVLEQAQQMVSQLRLEFPGRHRYTIDLMQIQSIHAGVYRERSQTDEAEQIARQGLKLFEQLPEQLQSEPNTQFIQAQNLGELAHALNERDQFEDAESYFRQSESLLTQLNGKMDQETTDHQLIRVLISYGNLLEQIGDIDEASAIYARALALCENLISLEQVYPGYRQLLARSCDHLAEVVWQQEGPRAAEEFSRRALDQARQLTVEYPNVPQFQHELASSAASLGFYMWQPAPNSSDTEHSEQLKERKKEIAELYTQAIDIVADLIEKHSDMPMYQEVLANTYNNLGIFYSFVGDWSSAVQAYDGSVEAQLELIANLGESPGRVSLLGATLNNLAMVTAGDDNLQGACDQFLQAIEFQTKALASNSKNPNYRAYLRNHYSGLARTYSLLGSTDKAIHYGKECLRIAREMFQDQGDIADYRGQLNSQCDLMAIYLVQAGLENRLAEARDLVKEAATRSPHWRFYQMHLAELECRLGNIEQAQQIVEEAQKLEDSDDRDYELLVEALIQCEQGNKSQATKALKESAKLATTRETNGPIYDRYFWVRINLLREEVEKRLRLQD